MTDTSAKLTVKLRFDWGSGPFWALADDGGFDDFGCDEITEVVPLSDELVAAVTEWDERMQHTYNREVPQDSGIQDPVEEARWKADGRELARRLKAEVGADVRVEYAPLGGSVEVIEY